MWRLSVFVLVCLVVATPRPAAAAPSQEKAESAEEAKLVEFAVVREKLDEAVLHGFNEYYYREPPINTIGNMYSKMNRWAAEIVEHLSSIYTDLHWAAVTVWDDWYHQKLSVGKFLDVWIKHGDICNVESPNERCRATGSGLTFHYARGKPKIRRIRTGKDLQGVVTYTPRYLQIDSILETPVGGIKLGPLREKAFENAVALCGQKLKMPARLPIVADSAGEQLAVPSPVLGQAQCIAEELGKSSSYGSEGVRTVIVAADGAGFSAPDGLVLKNIFYPRREIRSFFPPGLVAVQL